MVNNIVSPFASSSSSLSVGSARRRELYSSRDYDVVDDDVDDVFDDVFDGGRRRYRRRRQKRLKSSTSEEEGRRTPTPPTTGCRRRFQSEAPGRTTDNWRTQLNTTHDGDVLSCSWWRRTRTRRSEKRNDSRSSYSETKKTK